MNNRKLTSLEVAIALTSKELKLILLRITQMDVFKEID